MTIRKGEPWGEPVERPPDLIRFGDDASLASALAVDPGAEFGISAGDLHRAIGAPPDRGVMQRLPVDGMDVVTDHGRFGAVAHVVARYPWWRGSWWHGPVVVVTNVGHLGEWNVAPRAHPNDGRLDVVVVDPTMTLRERWQARSRLRVGTHVPHPHIAVRTATGVDEVFASPLLIIVDGREVGRSRRLQVDVVPDAHTIIA